MPERPLLRRRICLALAALVVAGGAGTIASLQWIPYHGDWINLFCGLLFGTFYSHAVLAGIWTVLGRGPLALRLPIAAVWTASLSATYVYVNLGPEFDVEYFSISIFFQTATWLLTVILVSGLAYGLRLRLSHPDDPPEPARRQFTLRQMLIAMTLAAAALAAWQSGVLGFPRYWNDSQDILRLFVMYVVAGTTTCLPLALALLLPEYWKSSTAAALALGLAVLGAEALLLHYCTFTSHWSVQEGTLTFGVQAAWTTVLAGLIRAAGYRLAR
jgi:hypothetical protein